MLLKEIKEQTNNLTNNLVFNDICNIITINPAIVQRLPISFKNILFIKKAIKVHGNKYDYSNLEYKNTTTNIEINCFNHGSFFQSPCNHLAGKGCPKCAILNKSNNTEKWVKKVEKIHDNKYDYSKVKYINNHTFVEIVCKKHGIFKQRPTHHLTAKQGCPACANSRRQGRGMCSPKEQAYLYYVKIEKYNNIYYKIGITSQVEKTIIGGRFGGEKAKITLLKKTLFNTGDEAFNEEQKILKKFNIYRYSGPNVLTVHGGDTEMFTKDVLKLDTREKEYKKNA